jgi:hypothetical protein
MKLTHVSVAVSLLVAMVNVYAEKSGNTVTEPSGPCKVEGGKVTSFTPHKLAGPMTYTSSDPTTISVNSETGILTGKKRGTVQIIATQAASNKAKGDSKLCTLTVKGKNPNLRWNPGVVNNTVAFEPNKTVHISPPTASGAGKIVYISDNPNVAEISSDGTRITIKDEYAAQVTFTVRQQETDLFEPAETTFSLKIEMATGGIRFTAGSGQFELQ